MTRTVDNSPDNNHDNVVYPIVTRLLKERYELNRSPTLENWLTQTNQVLNTFCDDVTHPKLKKQAQQIGQAYELADQLIEYLLAQSQPKSASHD